MRVAVAEQGDRAPVGVGQVVRGQDDAAGLRDVLLARPPVPDQQPQHRGAGRSGEQPPARGVALGRRLASAFAHEVSLLVQVVRCRGRIECMTDKAWSVLMPVKVLAGAKSRLADAWPVPRRAELALALASDTVTAVLGVRRGRAGHRHHRRPGRRGGAGRARRDGRAGRAARRAQPGAAARRRGAPPPAGPATGRPRCPPTCPRCGPSRSAGRCAPPRPGRRPSWPTPPVTARRCTPRRRGRRSGPRSAWPRGPGTPRAAPSNSASTASPGCAGTWTRRPTCAARSRSGWARTARRLAAELLRCAPPGRSASW